MKKFSIFNFPRSRNFVSLRGGQFSILLLIALLGILFLPRFSFAGEPYTACTKLEVVDGEVKCIGPVTVTYEGLVPCGKEVKVDGEKVIPCQLCHFFVMFKTIIDFVIRRLVPVVAVLMLVIAGVMFMVHRLGGAEIFPGGAGGGPALLSRAKRLLTSVIIGLIIIFAAWLIINTFFMIIGVAEWTGLREWFKIDCPIVLPK